MTRTVPSVPLRTSLLGILGLIATSCGGGGGGGTQPPPTPELRVVAFATPPSAITAGDTISPAVQVSLLRNGVIDANAVTPVTLTLAGGSGTGALQGTTTVAAVNGIATFTDLTVDTAGSFTLQAASGEFGTGVSPSFAVQDPIQPMLAPPFIDSLALAQNPIAVRASTQLTYTASGTIDSVRLDPGGIDLTTTGVSSVQPFPRTNGESIGVGARRAYKVFASNGNNPREYLDSSSLAAIGDGGAVVEATDIAVDAAGGYWVIGNFDGSLRFAPNTSSQIEFASQGTDVFVARYDAMGQWVWARSMSGPNDDDGRSIVRLPNGDVALVGTFSNTLRVNAGRFDEVALAPTGGLDPFVVVLQPNGDLRRAYVPQTATAGDESCLSVAAGIDGGLVHGGETHAAPPLITPTDFVVSSESVTGSQNFKSDFRGPGADQCTGVATSTGRGVAFVANFEQTVEQFAGSNPIAGTARSSAGATDVYVGVLDARGTLVWSAQIGGPGADAGFGVAMDDDGNVTVSGSFVGSAEVRGAQSTQVLNAVGGANDFDIFVASFDAMGNLRWADRAGGTTLLPGTGPAPGDESRGAQALADGSVVVTGYFTGEATFGAGTPSEMTVTAGGGPGDTDAFVARYLSDGRLGYATRLGNDLAIDEGAAAAATADGTVYWTGYVGGAATLTTLAGPDSLATAGVQDAFVARLTPRNYRVVVARPTGFDDATRLADIAAAANDKDRALDTAALPDGGWMLVGWFEGTLRFNPGTASEITLTSSGDRDGFYARQRRDGSTAWARQVGSGGIEMVTGVAVDPTGAIAVSGIFDGGLPIPSEGGTDIFVMEVDPESGAPTFVQASGSSRDDGGIRRATPVSLDDGGVDVAYHPQDTFGSVRSISVVSTVDIGFNVFSTIWKEGNRGNRTRVFDASAFGPGLWIQQFDPNGFTFNPRTPYVGLGNSSTDRGRSIAVGEGDVLYVTGTYNADFELTIQGPGVNPFVIPAVPFSMTERLNGFAFRIRSGEPIREVLLRNDGRDDLRAVSVLDDGKIVIAGSKADTATGPDEGLVIWLNGRTMQPSPGAFLTGTGPVLAVNPLVGDRVAIAGYIDVGAHPFAPGQIARDTAFVGAMAPQAAASVEFMGGIGRDRATGVATLVDGSTLVCGYVLDGSAQTSAATGNIPLAVFGTGTVNETRLDTDLGTPLADPFFARYILQE